MKRRVVGTAGHIDHGKTALVRAITGIDCDRLPEEKRRGITIDLGFANWSAGEYQIGFIDVPGHERFVKNMLAGVGGIDSVVLVVAADESIKPQTREHLAICKLLRIPTGVVAVTKSDLVEPEILDLVRLEIEELVRGTFLEAKPVIPVSSVTGRGIDELKESLLASVASVGDRDASTRLFRLPIDRVFTLKGFGTVVTGTTISGTLGADSEVEILPGALRSRARNIQVHGTPRDEALAGERTSVNLADIDVGEIARGWQIVAPGAFRASQILTGRLELLPDSGPLKDQARVRFHLYSAELLGSIRIVDDHGAEIRGGEDAVVQFRLESPVLAIAGDRFVIRRYSPPITIGGGIILDAHLPKLRRGSRPEMFDILARGTLGERLTLLARLAGIAGITLRELQTRSGIRAELLARELEREETPHLIRLGDGLDRRWLHRDVVRDLRKRAMEFLTRYFESNRMSLGVPKGEFLQKLLPPGVDAGIAAFAMSDLAQEKIVRIEGDLIDVPGRSKELGGSEGELARAIEMRFREAELKAPPVSELIQTIAQKPKVIEGVISFLVRRGTLVRLAEGIYLHRDVVDAAKERIAQHRGETIDVGWFKELFGLSRKVAIPLLEFFDRAGVTKRTGDRRLIL